MGQVIIAESWHSSESRRLPAKGKGCAHASLDQRSAEILARVPRTVLLPPWPAQMATALYFIDKLALRAGHEKDEDEADTVGCCTLKVGEREGFGGVGAGICLLKLQRTCTPSLRCLCCGLVLPPAQAAFASGHSLQSCPFVPSHRHAGRERGVPAPQPHQV